MDPLSVLGIFMGLAGGAGALMNLGNANAMAKSTQAEETQLLNEATQAHNQEEAEPALIAQRNSQESEISGPTEKWTASDTILTDPLQTPQPTETNTAQPAQQVGV